jgi:hypothetical protein
MTITLWCLYVALADRSKLQSQDFAWPDGSGSTFGYHDGAGSRLEPDAWIDEHVIDGIEELIEHVAAILSA